MSGSAGSLGRNEPHGSTMPEASGVDPFTVVIPALNEEERIAAVIIEAQRAGAARVIVAEGSSVDGTAAAAVAAGADVVTVADLAPGGPSLGKGDALWRAVGLVDTPITVFLDGDLFIDGPDFIGRLVEPVRNGAALFSKGTFERIRPEGVPREPGRITVLVAQPLLSLLHPELAQMTEPLSGQIAARTDLLRRLPFEVDYGLEIGMLLDVLALHGPAALAHPDCGELGHLSQTESALNTMAIQVMSAAFRRAGVVSPGDTRAPARPPHDSD